MNTELTRFDYIRASMELLHFYDAGLICYREWNTAFVLLCYMELAGEQD